MNRRAFLTTTAVAATVPATSAASPTAPAQGHVPVALIIDWQPCDIDRSLDGIHVSRASRDEIIERFGTVRVVLQARGIGADSWPWRAEIVEHWPPAGRYWRFNVRVGRGAHIDEIDEPGYDDSDDLRASSWGSVLGQVQIRAASCLQKLLEVRQIEEGVLDAG